jgi:serine/threonine protein kinase
LIFSQPQGLSLFLLRLQSFKMTASSQQLSLLHTQTENDSTSLENYTPVQYRSDNTDPATNNIANFSKTSKRKLQTMPDLASSEEVLSKRLESTILECKTSIDKVIELCPEPTIQKLLEEVRVNVCQGVPCAELIQQLHHQQQVYAQRPWRPQITRLLLLLGRWVRLRKLMDLKRGDTSSSSDSSSALSPQVLSRSTPHKNTLHSFAVVRGSAKGTLPAQNSAPSPPNSSDPSQMSASSARRTRSELLTQILTPSLPSPTAATATLPSVHSTAASSTSSAPRVTATETRSPEKSVQLSLVSNEHAERKDGRMSGEAEGSRVAQLKIADRSRSNSEPQRVSNTESATNKSPQRSGHVNEGGSGGEVLCRICENMVPSEQLAQHSEYCIVASQYDMKLARCDMKFSILESHVQKTIADVRASKYHAVVARDLSTLETLSHILERATAKSSSSQIETVAACLTELRALVNTYSQTTKNADSFVARKLHRAETLLQEKVQTLRKRKSLPVFIESPRRKETRKDFKILKPIAKGAFGKVYLARKKRTGDLYAIKVLRKVDMIRKKQVDRIKIERDIMAMTSMDRGLPSAHADRIGYWENPFVVNFYYSFQSKRHLYMVMEYMPGGDMYSLLKAMNYLDEDMTRFYAAEIVQALEYLHERGITHRDLKPDNLLIGRNGHIKLTDFGLSRYGLLHKPFSMAGDMLSASYQEMPPPSPFVPAEVTSPRSLTVPMGTGRQFLTRSHGSTHYYRNKLSRSMTVPSDGTAVGATASEHCGMNEEEKRERGKQNGLTDESQLRTAAPNSTAICERYTARAHVVVRRRDLSDGHDLDDEDESVLSAVRPPLFMTRSYGGEQFARLQQRHGSTSATVTNASLSPPPLLPPSPSSPSPPPPFPSLPSPTFLLTRPPTHWDIKHSLSPLLESADTSLVAQRTNQPPLEVSPTTSPADDKRDDASRRQSTQQTVATVQEATTNQSVGTTANLSLDPESVPPSISMTASLSQHPRGSLNTARGKVYRRYSFVGTPDYLAPEVLLGTGHSFSVDWWALGVIVFEFLTGIPPFNDETEQNIFENILNRKIPWEYIPDEVSMEARDFIDRLLCLKTEDRLGAHGAAEVKAHPWFKNIVWDTLRQQEPPFKPNLEDEEDTSYFDDERIQEGHWSITLDDNDSDTESSSDSDVASSSNNPTVPSEAHRTATRRGHASRSRHPGNSAVDDETEIDTSAFHNFSFINLPQLGELNKRVALHNTPGNTPRDSPRRSNWTSQHSPSAERVDSHQLLSEDSKPENNPPTTSPKALRDNDTELSPLDSAAQNNPLYPSRTVSSLESTAVASTTTDTSLPSRSLSSSSSPSPDFATVTRSRAPPGHKNNETSSSPLDESRTQNTRGDAQKMESERELERVRERERIDREKIKKIEKRHSEKSRKKREEQKHSGQHETSLISENLPAIATTPTATATTIAVVTASSSSMANSSYSPSPKLKSHHKDKSKKKPKSPTTQASSSLQQAKDSQNKKAAHKHSPRLSPDMN